MANLADMDTARANWRDGVIPDEEGAYRFRTKAGRYRESHKNKGARSRRGRATLSFHESFHRILDTLPYVSDVGFIQCGIEVSADWFVRYDIKPRGVKSISRMTYWISESDLQDIARERPGAKRAPGVEYRWKEVY